MSPGTSPRATRSNVDSERSQGPFSRAYWPPDTSARLHEWTVGQLLAQATSARPDATALVALAANGLRREWKYGDLYSQAVAAARSLLRRFARHDRVAVWAPNGADWVLLEFGAALAGLTLVTINPAFRRDELRYVLGQSRASGLYLADEYRGHDLLEQVRSVRAELPDLREVIRLSEWDPEEGDANGTVPLPRVDPAEPAQMQYTSGTTGFPKGALLRHRSVVNNAFFMGERLQMSFSDRCLNYMPMFHTGGCVCGTLIPVAFQATHVLMGGFDAGQVLEAIGRERVTVIGGVPTMYLAMMEHPDLDLSDLSTLRAGWTGGATVPAELVRRIEGTLGLRLSIVFGQTETSPTITQTRLTDSDVDKAETVGQPLPCTEVKIVDPVSGQIVQPGEAGELCARGYLVMAGYFDMPEQTASTIDGDGWLHTGDLCSMDERGYFSVEGRIKDMIIRGGENLYPREIEAALMEHPLVQEAAVLGVSDPKWGEQPAAFVRAAPGSDLDEEELNRFIRNRLAPHKAPRIWRFVESFPLTPSGKIQKFVLKETLERERATTAEPRDGTP